LGLGDERRAAIGCGVALATPHPLATAAGLAAAGRGGNAVDAAVAAAVSLAVVCPHLCSAGGDAVALLAYPGGMVEYLDAGGAAGLRADAEALRREHGAMPAICPHAVTVPGAVSAWGLLSERAARLPLADLLRDAIEQARDGVPVAPGLHRALLAGEDLLAVDTGMREVLFRDGRPLGAGQMLRQPALAATLAEVAERGWRSFYQGPVADRLVAGMVRLGVPLDEADLARHAPEPVAPLRARCGDREVLTAPPGSPGPVLAEILAACGRLAGRRLLGCDAGLLAEVLRQASAGRGRCLADPEGGAAAVVAMDAAGFAISMLQSVFHPFGAGLLEPETGLVLHNWGACFSLDPTSPDLLSPGRRPPHTLVPVLELDRDGPAGAHGAAGGGPQPQIHAHLLLNLLLGRTPADSLAAPRWVVRADRVHAERGVPAAALASIAAAGFEVVETGGAGDEVGHGQLVRRGPTGELLAATDPRADGLAEAN
jgi:gamma-glutamyltranspeptidase/glutathione hydrolase